MQFTVENEPFAKALALVKGCILSRSTIPILMHVVVEAQADSKVTVRATNLDREAEAECPAEVTAPGSAALHGEVLSEVARKLTKGGQASLAIKDDRCKVVSGSSRYNLRILPALDYPARKEMPEGATTFAIAGNDLAEMIRATLYAAADRTDERIYFRGVHLHLHGGKLIAVATDGKRLAQRTMPIPKGAATMPPIIIPAEAAKQVADFIGGMDEAIEIAVTEKAIQLRWPGCRFHTQLTDAKFPDYRARLPKPNGHAVRFRPYVLSEAIDRVSVVYRGDVSLETRIPFTGFKAADNGIELQCGARAHDQATETIEAETNGTALEFRTNPQHMIDMLQRWPENVNVDVQQEKELAPVLFTSPDLPEQLALVMPSAIGA